MPVMGRASRAALVILATATAAMLIANAIPARADESPERDLVARINAERSARGIGTVRVASDLADVAEDHTRDMAADGAVYHVPNIERRAPGWSMLGDNVGAGPSAGRVFDGFMDSESHRENLLRESFTHVGVGVVQNEDFTYVTVILGGRSEERRIERVEASHADAPTVRRAFRPRRTERPREEPASPSPRRRSVPGPGAAVRALVALTAMDAPDAAGPAEPAQTSTEPAEPRPAPAPSGPLPTG